MDDDLSFLGLYADEDGTNNSLLKVQLPDGQVSDISGDICPYKLLDACPLLYHAFEYGHQTRHQACIEAPSRASAISLLRYCYTGSYLPFDAEYAPVSFLLHAETYKLAVDFDIPELQLLAHGNFTCQVDFACCMPEPPHDLHETLRFVYRYFSSFQSRQQHGLVNTLLNYCVSTFQYQRLGNSHEFLELVRQTPEFRQDLCFTNMQRNFEDECASDIIGLALDTLHPQANVRPTTLASRDLPQEMLFDRPATPRPLPTRTIQNPMGIANSVDADHYFDRMTSQPLLTPNFDFSSTATLVHRPKAEQPVVEDGFETVNLSDDEEYSLVRAPQEEPMSSPEVLSARPIDVLALTGSDYPTDDEWTVL